MSAPLRENRSLAPTSQRAHLLALLGEQGMARLSEIIAEGVTSATISRLTREGAVVRLGRGLYQLPDAELDANHALAEAAKRVPKGVIALTSALAFHGVTDQMPRKVWIAIGLKDWAPRDAYPPMKITRFTDRLLRAGMETHVIEGVSVPVFTLAKTLSDSFRRRSAVGLDVAVQALRETLRQRKAAPSEIADQALQGGSWTIMRPYLEAFAADDGRVPSPR